MAHSMGSQTSCRGRLRGWRTGGILGASSAFTVISFTSRIKI